MGWAPRLEVLLLNIGGRDGLYFQERFSGHCSIDFVVDSISIGPNFLTAA